MATRCINLPNRSTGNRLPPGAATPAGDAPRKPTVSVLSDAATGTRRRRRRSPDPPAVSDFCADSARSTAITDCSFTCGGGLCSPTVRSGRSTSVLEIPCMPPAAHAPSSVTRTHRPLSSTSSMSSAPPSAWTWPRTTRTSTPNRSSPHHPCPHGWHGCSPDGSGATESAPAHNRVTAAGRERSPGWNSTILVN